MYLEKQWMMLLVFGSLTPKQEIQMELQALGSDLAQPIADISGMNHWKEAIFLSVSLLYPPPHLSLSVTPSK